MRFQRPQIITHNTIGIDPASGMPHTLAAVAQIRVDDLVLGNGTAFNILQDDGTIDAVTSIVLPAAYDGNALFEILLRDNKQVFLSVHTIALGAAALTGIVAVIEFNDPDHPAYWLASREGIARDAGFAANEFTLLGVGDWTVASRVEHMQHKKARVRFHIAGGAVAAGTEIVCSFHLDGGQSLLTNNQP
jgi:hypothetical protein